MSLDHSVQGAKHQSFRKYNPRHLLISLVEANPEASKHELMEMLRVEIENDETRGYFNVMLEYWFIRNYDSLMGRTAARRRVRATLAAAVKEQAKTQLQGSLLDLMMPNGKLLRDCTRADLRHIGGFATKLIGKLPARKTVGDVLSETEVRSLWLR
jgi:hypothetical protein